MSINTNKHMLIESKMAEFCRKKGWDLKNLTTNQMLIISKLISEKNI